MLQAPVPMVPVPGTVRERAAVVAVAMAPVREPVTAAVRDRVVAVAAAVVTAAATVPVMVPGTDLAMAAAARRLVADDGLPAWLTEEA